MSKSESVFGIDLGTTNSVIAVVRDGVPQVLEVGGSKLLPSVVGLAPDGSLLVGTPARNQLAAFPERTIASAKRRMGSDHKFRLGDRELTPPEVSALILKELCRGAAEATGETVKKVVITVPAFFQDAQRNATRLAGEIAGLEVVRLINEPTAAALAFEGTEPGRERTLLVYDLGGGTFDVSVVVTDGELTEVLASHGDVQLGGDDFDALLGEWLTETLADQPGWDAEAEDPVAFARILEASERAKRQLTEEVAVRVREEFLKSGPTPVHLDAEVTREDFEDLIEPLLEQTLDSVHEALDRAGKTMAEIDDVVLVGGQTRTPRVAQRLQAITGHSPRRDVHPDLCVALGAAIAGAQAAGIETGRVLVDVTPYTFGVEVVEGVGSQLLEHRFAPVVERGTPLPVTRSETFTTVRRDQREVDVRVLQGESRDARHNLLVGRFTFDQLPEDLPAHSPVHFRFRLGLDGILDVEVTEPSTGRTVAARIEDATARLSADELAAARARTMALWGEESDEDESEDDEPEATVAPGSEPEWKTELRAALKRTAALTARMSEDDRADAAELADEAEEALTADDQDRGRALRDALLDLCDYAEDL